MLGNLEALEIQLLRSMNPQGNIEALKTIAWENTIAEVLLPDWRGVAAKAAPALQGVTPSDLPALAENLIQFGRKVIDRNELLPFKEIAARGEAALGCALALALYRNGWAVESEVGEPVRLKRDGRMVEPFSIVRGLESRSLSSQDWLDRCAEYGISGISLALSQDANGNPA